MPVIPGKAGGRDPESRSRNWIPAFAGMFMRLRRTLDDETFVGANRRSPLRGRLGEPPLPFGGMTFPLAIHQNFLD
jgi:hypothetical protein